MSCLPQLLEKYSNLILCVQDDENLDPLWLRFYQIQMAQFILGSASKDFCLTRAIAAYNKISEKWLELHQELEESAIPVRNFDNICRDTYIDFN